MHLNETDSQLQPHNEALKSEQDNNIIQFEKYKKLD